MTAPGIFKRARILAGAALVRAGARLLGEKAAPPVETWVEPDEEFPHGYPVVSYGARAQQMRASGAPVTPSAPVEEKPLAGSAAERMARARGM